MEDNMDSKTELVRKHLREHKSITTKEAYDLYDSTRLSAIILNLRNAGANIESVWMTRRNKHNKIVRYVNYEYRGGL